MKPVRAALAAIVLLLGAASQADAQDCGYVEFCGLGHFLTLSSPENSCYHSNCMTCGGGVCHPLCRAGCDQGEGDDGEVLNAQQLAIIALINAADRRDVEQVVALSRSMPNHVTYNTARQSVQVRGCNGALIANLPLRGRRDFQVAASLPLARSSLNLVGVLGQRTDAPIALSRRYTALEVAIARGAQR